MHRDREDVRDREAVAEPAVSSTYDRHQKSTAVPKNVACCTACTVSLRSAARTGERDARPAEHEERRRDHHDDLVLRHVRREQEIAQATDGRDEGEK